MLKWYTEYFETRSEAKQRYEEIAKNNRLDGQEFGYVELTPKVLEDIIYLKGLIDEAISDATSRYGDLYDMESDLATRRAEDELVDYILPKLFKHENLSGDDFYEMLTDKIRGELRSRFE